MAQQSDARTKEFAEQTGIHAAEGEKASILKELSRQAYELIKIVELERCGIRDGAGSWYGCDPLGGTAKEIEFLVDRYSTPWIGAGHDQIPESAEYENVFTDCYGEELPF